MEGKPIAEVGIGDLDVEDVLLVADVKRRLKPGLVAILVDLFFNVLEDLLPRVRLFFILHSGSLNFHRNIHNCGKPCSLAEGGSAKAREIIAFRKTDFKRVKKRRKNGGIRSRGRSRT
jgi:hypothetical protein